jgi:hypothetical protein
VREREPSDVAPNFGRFSDEASALDGVVGKLAAAFDPREIWLFGSRARGDARPDSDFDLLLVAKPNGDFGSDDYERIIRPVRGLGVGCDIVPCSADEFARFAPDASSFIGAAVREGRKVYEA